MQRLGIFDLDVTRAQFISILLLVANAFSWYLIAFEVLTNVLDAISTTPYEITMIWAIHVGGVASAALIGATLSDQIINRNNLLSLWMSLGIVSTLVPMIIGTSSSVSIAIFSFLLGVSFGLGMPSSMAFYADGIAIDKRGRFGGIIYFVIGIGSFLLLITLLPFTRLTEQFMILAIWRGFGLVTFLVLKPKSRFSKMKRASYTEILRRKPFLFYLFPWIMFCLINSLAKLIIPTDIVRMSIVIGSAITGMFSLVGGVFSDLVGRKRVVITGFIILGIGYAILGTFPDYSISHYLFIVTGNIAGGMFGAVFLMSLWGDLAENMASEKYYAIGGLPYLLSGFFGFIISDYVKTLIPLYAIFSFSSFFLFLSVLPLWFAPETLPEKVVQERLLRQYIENARKVKENM